MKTLNKLKIFMIVFIAVISISSISAQCTASFTYTINGNGGISFTNNSTGSFNNVTWNFGDGNTAWGDSLYGGSFLSASNTYPYNGVYVACLTISDSSISCYSTFCDTITISNSIPTCSSSISSSYDSVLTYYFDATTIGVSPLSYFWDFGDGNTSSLPNQYHSYLQPGNYNVIVVVTDANGCVSSDTINVSSTCTAGFTSVNNGGGSFSFTPIINSPTAIYNWNFGDNTSSVVYNPNHLYASDGPYWVCLTVSDTAFGCNSTYCDSVVASGTGNINCTFPFGAYGNQNGSTFNFWQQSNGSTFFWDFGDGTTSNQANPSHTYLSSGVYNYCVTVDNCPMVCNSINVLSCQSSFYYYPDSLNVFDVTVVNTASGNNLTYFWGFGDGNTSTQQYPQHTYAFLGTYYLCLTINNGSGCSDMFCDSINASGLHKQTGFTINVQAPFATGIENQEAQLISDLSIYPNPVKDNLTIEINLVKSTNVQMMIVDLLGNVVANISNKEMNSGVTKLHWNVSDVANGIYLLNIKTENTLQIKKIVISK